MPKFERSELGKLHIAKLNGWTLSVVGDQHVLGFLIIFPKREIIGSLVEMTDEELLTFKKISKIAEDLLKEAFNAEWFNYSQEGNVVKKIHFQLKPRYSTERIFEGHKFTDEGWGHPIKYLNSEDLPPKEVVFKITKKLRDILRGKVISDFNIEIIEV